MNLAKGISIVWMTIGLVLIVTTNGCKKSPDAQMVPDGVLRQHTSCKEFVANASGPMDEFAPGPHDDCIEYQYNGRDTLILSHINAGFNCCPGEITADIEFSGNMITITEREANQLCDCLCLFDLDYEIINLATGEYTLRVIGLYVQASDQVLEFPLQLLSETSGHYCLQRDYYPWK